MLQFIPVSHPRQIKELLKSYEPLTDTWIVSDLKSKQEIQNEALLKHSFYTDDAILRVSDFWRLWIRRTKPSLHVVSADFIRSLVQLFVEEHGTKLEISESEVSTLYKAVQEFAPLLLHPASDDVLQEWLSGQQIEKKWQRWYQLAKVCINFIVQDQNAIDSKWSAAYLQSADLSSFKWDRKIFVDLGSELTSIEMGLLKQLGQQTEVIVIAPAPAWKSKFPHLLNTYQENFGYGQLLPQQGSSATELDKTKFVRVSTQLAEIKFAVSIIREWADSGIPLSEIAVVSAEIESYWPVLQYYLEVEGIAARKDNVAQLNSLGDVQNLLAAIKNYSNEVAWDSLEKSGSELKFEKFKALFYQLYDEDDLGRDQKIKSLYYRKFDFSADFERDEFLKFVVKIWISFPNSSKKNEVFELLIKDLLAQSLNIKMKLQLWIKFLKTRLSRKEIALERSATGIQVLPLMSAHMLNADHKVYLGLNDEFYHKKQSPLMPVSDSMALKQQFDLAVEATEESYLDFNLRWQCEGATKNTWLTSAHLSFKSEPLNSSLFFIENSPQSEISAPGATRADERQAELAGPDIIFSNERFVEDKKGFQKNINSEIFRRLSTSDLENYARCSFKLLASRGFRLRDYAQVSIDLDPREKGTIVHALFEHIIGLMQNGLYSQDTVAAFLDLKRTELGLYQNQDSIWAVQKTKFLQLAQKFYEFEKSRIEIFSVSTEKQFEIYFDLKNKCFTVESNPDFFTFSLRVDRIDIHKRNNYCVIYDYKSSESGLASTNKWLTEFQFQMLLYLMALKLTLPKELAVKGSLYYLYKNFNLKKGVIDESIGLNEFLFNARNSSLLNDDERQQLETDFVQLAGEILERLSGGEFSNIPYDIKICKDCDWRKLCRATHLM